MQEYNDSAIRALSDKETVRLRPFVYISEEIPMQQMITEIIDNALDECMNGFSDSVEISISTKDYRIRVTDHGRGLPQGINAQTGLPTARIVCDTLSAGGKFNQDVYATGSGLHGMGLSVVQFLSKEFYVRTWRDGNELFLTFKDGDFVSLDKKEIPDKKAHGTEVTYTIDDSLSVFDNDKSLDAHLKSIERRLRLVSSIYDDFKIIYNGEELLSKSLEDFLPADDKYQIPLDRTFRLVSKKYRVICGWNDSIKTGEIDSYGNLVHTKLGGDHVNAVLDAVKDVFGKESSILGMNALVSAVYGGMTYNGQSKTRAKSKEMYDNLYNEVKTSLRQWLKQNPDLDKKLRELIDIKEEMISKRAHKRRENKKDRKADYLAALDNQGFVDASSRDRSECELHTAEGLSAAATLKMARDTETQAVMPLRGKIISPYSNLKDLLDNKEVSTIISKLGCGILDDCDPSKCRYSKIIHCGDSDEDGFDILCSLIALYSKLMPKLVEAGMVYALVTPLYITHDKKGKLICIWSEEEKAEYLKKGFRISRMKGLGEWNVDDFKYMMNNETRHLLRISPDTDMNEIHRIRGGSSSERLDLLKEMDVYHVYSGKNGDK